MTRRPRRRHHTFLLTPRRRRCRPTHARNSAVSTASGAMNWTQSGQTVSRHWCLSYVKCPTDHWPVQPVDSQAPFTRYNRFSNLLNNRLNNRLHRVNKHSTRCSTVLTTSWMFVYTKQPVVQPRLSNRPPVEQPVVQPVVQPVWQPVVSCKWGFSKLNWQKQIKHTPAARHLSPLRITCVKCSYIRPNCLYL